MNDDYIYLDQEGYERYKKSINELIVELGEIEERMNILKTTGDNQDEYEELMNLKKSLKKRIIDKRDQLTRVQIISVSNSDLISIGDTVKIKSFYNENDIKEEIYKLVSGESDYTTIPEELSINSPKGKAIFGKSIGVVTNCSIANNNIKIEILEKTNVKKLIKE